ncbi:hypothetical protein SB00610_00720 [Klebsiella quasipneumoniae subsp. similipneumoniae]|nr:hypothetical protein SB00610_00720 [Klebsiella quasipneumoniae subsp. similipneumoniae]
MNIFGMFWMRRKQIFIGRTFDGFKVFFLKDTGIFTRLTLSFFSELTVEINLIDEKQGKNLDLLSIQAKFFIQMFTDCPSNHMTLDEHRVNITYDITYFHIICIRRRFQCKITLFARSDLAYPVTLINITSCSLIKCHTVIYGNL